MSDPHHTHHTPQGPYDPPQVPSDPYGSQPGRPGHSGYGAPHPGYGQQPYEPPPYGYPQPPADPYTQQPAYQAPSQPGYGYGYGQQPQPMPYGYPGAPVAPPQNNLATASIVLGFVSIFGLCIPFASLLGPVSLGLGIAALNRAKRTGVGKNAAIGGIIVGSVSLLILIGVVVFYVAALNKTG